MTNNKNEVDLGRVLLGVIIGIVFLLFLINFSKSYSHYYNQQYAQTDRALGVLEHANSNLDYVIHNSL